MPLTPNTRLGRYEIRSLLGTGGMGEVYLGYDTSLRRKHIELRQVLDVTAQVPSELPAAHETGIVHRDIKPENIKRKRDGLIKVLDFGLDKLADDAGSGARQEGIETEAPTKARVV